MERPAKYVMPMRGKISIIIPVYNSEVYLTECIDSVQQQSYSNWELILINDGSEDASLDIIRKYSESDKRIHFIDKSNTGVSDSRNVGIQKSTGEFIMFIDSDDLLPSKSIQSLMNIMEKSDVDIVVGNYYYKYGRKLIPKMPRLRNGEYEYSQIKNIMIDDGTITGILIGSVCGNLYKSSFIHSNKILFNRNICINEDGMFNLSCICNNAKIFIIQTQFVYIYRQWKSSAVQYQDMINKFKMCDNFLCKMKFNNLSLESFDRQIKLRKLTEVFQVSLVICNSFSYKKAKTALRKIWLNTDLACSGISSEINCYKKFLYFLIMNNNKFIFYFIIRFIYPILKKNVKR